MQLTKNMSIDNRWSNDKRSATLQIMQNDQKLDFKIFCMNTRSITMHFNEIKNMMESLYRDFDVNFINRNKTIK